MKVSILDVTAAHKEQLIYALQEAVPETFGETNFRCVSVKTLKEWAIRHGITQIEVEEAPPAPIQSEPAGGTPPIPITEPSPTLGGRQVIPLQQVATRRSGGIRGGTEMSDAKLDELARALREQGAKQEDIERLLTEQPQKIAEALRPSMEGLPDQFSTGMVEALRAAGMIPQEGAPPPAIAAGAANISRIVGKTLDESADILPPGYVINDVSREHNGRILLDHIIRYTIDDHNIAVVVSDGPEPGEIPEIPMARRPTRSLPRAHAEPVQEETESHSSGGGIVKDLGEGFVNGLLPWRWGKRRDR